MASEQPDGVEQGGGDESHEPRECMPCRGTGKLLSNLGGEPSSVTCPWCQGGGVRIAGIDAQAHWKQQQPGVTGEQEGPAEAD
jgi:DnaJ-class molecular chaperone